MQNKTRLRIIAVALPILAVIGFLVLKFNIDFFVGLLPDHCIFYLITGLQCTACGNTRCVLALLRGDIIAAIGYNITIPLIILGLLLLYIELFSAAFLKKRIHVFPQKTAFWVCLAVFMVAYYILRNLF